MRLFAGSGLEPGGPADLCVLRAPLREIVDEQVAGVAKRESFDFVTDLAVELPLQVIAELLGIPPEDRAKVFSWTEQMMSGDDAEFANDPEEIMAALGAIAATFWLSWPHADSTMIGIDVQPRTPWITSVVLKTPPVIRSRIVALRKPAAA